MCSASQHDNVLETPELQLYEPYSSVLRCLCVLGWEGKIKSHSQRITLVGSLQEPAVGITGCTFRIIYERLTEWSALVLSRLHQNE